MMTYNAVYDSAPLDPLCENMTSSTKPEVHSVLHCRQKRPSHGHISDRDLWICGFNRTTLY